MFDVQIVKSEIARLKQLRADYDKLNINAKSGIVSFKKSIDILPKAERVINKSKRRLSNNLSSLIMILDECISKSQELLKSIL